MMKKVLTKSSRETQKLAGVIVKNLSKKSYRTHASVVGLSGQLGAGKTTIVQGIGTSLGIKEKIKSPTFVLMKIYKLHSRGNIPWKNLVHIDAYRIKQKREVVQLGLKDILKNPENVVFIEWAEKIKGALPRFTLWVELRHNGRTHRHILIKT